MQFYATISRSNVEVELVPRSGDLGKTKFRCREASVFRFYAGCFFACNREGMMKKREPHVLIAMLVTLVSMFTVIAMMLIRFLG